MIRLADHWYQPVTETISGLKIGATNLSSQALVKDDEGAVVDGRALRDAVHDYRQRVRGTYAPQLAALMFFATSRPAAMRGYFPLLRALEPAAIDDFEARTTAAARQLDLRLFDENQRGAVREVDLPRDAAYLVAGQIVEVFYFRQDILERLLAARTRIWLYATGAAYQAHGGVGGGCYSPGIGGIQLVLARLYEGFTGSMPGVAPLLHELGHLFDCFDVRRATQGAATGLYPGLRHEDGSLFTPDARVYFLRGKRLELDRYTRRREGRVALDEPLPIGHPYVFQNDGEFLAGYLELFFRNPHAFAAQNPALFAGYTLLFRQDPRRVWVEDFPFYLQQNRRFYLESGEQPWPTALTVPAD